MTFLVLPGSKGLRSICAKGTFPYYKNCKRKYWYKGFSNIFLWKTNLHCTHSSPLLDWLFFLLQVRQTGILLLSDIVVCFGNVPNSLWILAESNKIHEMLFSRQSQLNQGSLLLFNISKKFVSRREHFLWRRFNNHVKCILVFYQLLWYIFTPTNHTIRARPV